MQESVDPRPEDSRPESQPEKAFIGRLQAQIAELSASVDHLKAQLSAYDRVFLQSPVPALIYRTDTLTVLQANDGAVALYGFGREHFHDLRVSELFSDHTNVAGEAAFSNGSQQSNGTMQTLDRALRKAVNVLGPFLHRASEARQLLVRMTLFALQMEGVDARIAIIQDETARQTAEDDLRASEERYRELFENANDIIFLQDLNGRIQAANRAAESLTGYSRKELLGQDFAQLLPPEAHASMLDSIRAHLGGSPTHRYELPILPKSGSRRFLEVSTRIIYSKGHPVAIQGIGRDITERKLSQQRLQETAEELQMKNLELSTALRLAQEATQLKEQFLANTSHELRTPMNGIMGMASLLRDTELDTDQREYVDVINRCSNDLLTIINDLLDMSQIDAGRFTLLCEEFDIAESVRSVVKLLRFRAVGKGLSLDYRIDPKVPPTMLGDCVRFRQILVNLIANGIKFTSTGSVEVHLFLDETGTLLKCEVIDSGIGVEEAVQERIFEAFFQADGTLRRRYGGTGLGLSISKQLVMAMGGQIGTKNNTPQPGACFWFKIPLRPLDSAETGSSE